MTQAQQATTHTLGERCIQYGQRASLVGILTFGKPRPAPSRPCILIPNSGVIRKVGPARLGVHTARHLADSGFDVFRFDYAGVGDSPARTDGQSLGDGVVLDLRETMDHLQQSHHYEEFIVIGLCSGADNGMRAAEIDERIIGLAMLDPTIDRTPRWYWHRFWYLATNWPLIKSILTFENPELRQFLRTGSFKAETGEKPELYQVAYGDRASITDCLATLVERQTKLFVAFTGSWSFIYNYPSQFYDVYDGIDFSDLLELTYRPEADHMYLDSEDRKTLLKDLANWCLVIGTQHQGKA